MSEEDREAERAEERKRRNKDRLDDDNMMTWMMFMGAAMAGGEKPGVAAKSADQAIAETRRRFT